MSAKLEHLRDHLRDFQPTLGYDNRVLRGPPITSCVFSGETLQQCIHWAEHGMTRWVRGEQQPIKDPAEIAAACTDIIYSFLGERPLVMYCAVIHSALTDATPPPPGTAMSPSTLLYKNRPPPIVLCEIVHEDDMARAFSVAGAVCDRMREGREALLAEGANMPIECWGRGPSLYATLNDSAWRLVQLTAQHVDPALLALALETGYPLPPRFCAADVNCDKSVLVATTGDATTDANLVHSQTASMYHYVTRLVYAGTTAHLPPDGLGDTCYVPRGTFGALGHIAKPDTVPRSITDDLLCAIMSGTKDLPSPLLPADTLACLQDLCLVFVGIPAESGTWTRAEWVLAFKDRVKASIEDPSAPPNCIKAHGRIIIDDPYLMSAILYASQYSGVGEDHHVAPDIGVELSGKSQIFIDWDTDSAARSAFYEWLYQWIIANPTSRFSACSRNVSFCELITH